MCKTNERETHSVKMIQRERDKELALRIKSGFLDASSHLYEGLAVRPSVARFFEPRKLRGKYRKC